MPSSSVQDYLKALFKLAQATEHGRVRTKSIANELGVSLPSVTSMVKHLSESGFVTHEPYKGAALTATGTREAIAVIRAHRLIEVFLVEHLGYTWDEVHEEAERLEHAMSETFTNRLDTMLGFPLFDPHGDPIPNADGEFVRRGGILLPNLVAGDIGLISRVLEQSADVLQFLDSLDARPGAEIEVIRHDPFEGPIWVRIEATERALSRQLAGLIQVVLFET